MKAFSLLLIPLLLTACNTGTSKQDDQQVISWSVRFADAVMHESDSLIYFKRDKPKYDYDYSILAMAMDKLGSIDRKYSDYARTYIDYFVQEDGSVNGYKLSDYSTDRIRPGVNILKLYKETGEEKYLIATRTLVSQMETHPRTKCGGFWHKKIYPWQMWLDGIYMAHPLLTAYAKEFNEPKWYDEVTFQIKLIYEKTLDQATGLLYHGWDESHEQEWCNKETGQSMHFWGRGMGWYMMAIVDVLDYLPEDHTDAGALVDILNKCSEALLKVQDDSTGLWYQVLNMAGEEGNYPESSGSAMFIYAFARGARKGYLPEKYLEIADEAFTNLIKYQVVEDEEGYPVLTNTCGGAGLGGNPYRMGDYDYYIHERKVDNDQKGVAPLILAALELGR